MPTSRNSRLQPVPCGSSSLPKLSFPWAFVIALAQVSANAAAEDLSAVPVEGQPLAANVRRVVESLQFLGAPLPPTVVRQLEAAGQARDSQKLQATLDSHVLLQVSVNPEARVKVQRGPAAAKLTQGGYTPVLVKVVNESTGTPRLTIVSPQAGPVYAGVAELSMRRQQQERLRENQNVAGKTDRFLAVEMHYAPPMTERLSGLEVEYAIALIYSLESGKREATIGFDIGQGNQDLGFRGEVPVLFDVAPAMPVELIIRDDDGTPTMARLTIRDKAGHVYPPQAKRLAPDLFFQPHIYRADGEVVYLPPGTYQVDFSRGPEYLVESRAFTVSPGTESSWKLQLRRWIDPAEYGFFSGDHHIHAAGCAHYTSPTQGVTPKDMFRQVKGEGLNVGCVLTWGPCFDHQRQYFAPQAHTLSEPQTILKYDLEISGFGSQALGHVCLLNLKDQTYPGSEGTSTQGWPTWTTPVMRWAKAQGGFAGYAHSASGLAIDPAAAAGRILQFGDRDEDKKLNREEAAPMLLPEAFGQVDQDGSGELTLRELELSHERAADQLPNLAVPEMNGVGAMEICVSASEGVCDFISAMDTARIQEWNTWYHLLNCGLPLKVSGETDFPCMSGRRVGQGRVYVQVPDREQLDFTAWCRGMAQGASYVSDGFAHILAFQVTPDGNAQTTHLGQPPLELDDPTEVSVTAKVAFAPRQPLGVAYGNVDSARGRRVVGDTVLLHGERTELYQSGGMRTVDLVVNGKAAKSFKVPADGKVHEIRAQLPMTRSSWIAIRHFPQLHSNPISVHVGGQPIRASRDSARWCVAMTEQLWRNRQHRISAAEREEAKATFERALTRYRQIASESPADK